MPAEDTSFVVPVAQVPSIEPTREPVKPGICITVGPPPGCSLTDLSECPAGASCYPYNACGTTIYCCDSPPKCDPADLQLAQPCPTDGSCYERMQCGHTITCLRSDKDPAARSGADAGP